MMNGDNMKKLLIKDLKKINHQLNDIIYEKYDYKIYETIMIKALRDVITINKFDMSDFKLNDMYEIDTFVKFYNENNGEIDDFYICQEYNEPCYYIKDLKDFVDMVINNLDDMDTIVFNRYAMQEYYILNYNMDYKKML